MANINNSQEYLLLIEERLRQNWDKFSSEIPIHFLTAYHMGWVDENFQPLENIKGGKRLRPLFCVLINQALNGILDDALDIGSALEFLHNFSLVHDDIQDRDEKRHGKWTVWKIWGEAQAINVGDLLFNLAFQILANLSSPLLVSKSIQEVTHTIQELIEGQYLDLSFEQKKEVSLKEYMQMIDKKTAKLFATCFYLGAFSATYKDEISKEFQEIGEKFGLCFQIADDAMGIWGNPDKTGKNSLADLWRRKKTYPILYTYSEASDKERLKIEEIWSKEYLTDQDIYDLIELIEDKRAKEATFNLIEKFFNGSYKKLLSFERVYDISLIKEIFENYYDLIFSIQRS
ncbi:MAG TPA: polyprenyl synthetase family protein [Dictyoglomaceae bacterium]|nr:polyprenyl synthetase family protein [Dictyoglomaceae bacterium]HOL38888.1 polyprenyl synthetase family protein [Dictyoglomaceae bacterium]HOP94924.1 polyprenyl synthetase family protein [Dictyoglomaceae bacterium]HPP15695.1 polyprenyl synthetase family protein [Dictyoglomaceae bacterium]HPU43534.1 polyprenyl synthetase family protein [Dictyoglomaceae bacterium]